MSNTDFDPKAFLAEPQQPTETPKSTGFDPKEFLGTKQPKTTATEAFGRGLSSGATFNFYDELTGLARAGGLEPNDPDVAHAIKSLVVGGYRKLSGDEEAERLYNEQVAKTRAETQQMRTEHPYASTAGELTGAVAMPGMAAAKTATLPMRAMRGAGAGAVYGGLSGAGEGEDLTGRAVGAGIGTGAGALAGAAAVPAVALAGKAYDYFAKPAVSAVRGWINPEAQAASRVIGSIAEKKPGGQSLTRQEFDALKAAGEPVMVADLGEGQTKALLRSATNVSPEAHDLVTSAVQERFRGQSERAGSTIRSIVSGGANAAKTRAQLEAEYEAERGGAYGRAYAVGDRPIRPPEELMGSGSFVAAMKDAVERGKDRAIAEGHGAFNPGVRVTPDGRIEFLRGPSGVPAFPNLQFWDYTKRALDDAVSAAFRAGKKDEGSVLAKTRDKLRDALDAQVPEYKDARGIASTFFGGTGAIDAGERALSNKVKAEDIRVAMAKMKPAEREMFKEAHADALASKIEGMPDSNDVTTRIFNTPNERRKIAAIHGPQGVNALEMFLRRENIYDTARRALGNSTTVKQMIEAGLAGGAIGGYFGGEKGGLAGAAAGALGGKHAMYGAARAGATKLVGYVDKNVAKKVAELLVSDDPDKLRVGINLAARNATIANAVRSLSERISVMSGAREASEHAPAAATKLRVNPAKGGYATGGRVDNVVRKYDVPYLAGSSNDDKTVYIDRRVPRRIAVRRANGKGRVGIDPAKYLVIHETEEHKAMRRGVPYLKAHHEIATPAERRAVEADGIDWNDYEDVLDGYVNETEHEKLKFPPPDLYDKPYPHNKEVLIEKLERQGKAYGGRVGFQHGGDAELEPAVEQPDIVPAVGGQPARIVVRPPDPNATALEATRAVMPDTTSLLRGAPRPPIENFPEELGKIPSAEDPRIPGAGMEMLGMLPSPGMSLPVAAGAKLMASAAPLVTRYMPGMAEGAASLARRVATKVHPGWTGATPIEMMDIHPDEFHGAIGAAKEAHPYGAAVTLYDPADYANMRTFVAPDKSAGFAIKDGDDIVSVFRHPDSPHRNSAASMLSSAVQNGGRRLDAFDTELPHIYGRGGFRAVARIPFDPQFAPEGWNYSTFKGYNGGKPDVVFMVHDPYNPGYSPGDGVKVGSYDEAVAVQKQEADRIAERQAAGVKTFNDLSSQFTGLKGMGQYFTAPELERVTKNNAQKLTDIFSQLPSSEEMAATAYSGRAKRGWYRQSAQALVNIFGTADAPRFAALLAALSPQASVESNAINALRTWNEWVKAGRPTNSKDIIAVMGRSVQGEKGEESILGAWKGNTIRALQSDDPTKIQLSGPKVNSFMHNLRNNVHEVTNDAWMANYSNVDQKLFASQRVKDPNPLEGYEPKIGIKSPGYLAMNAAVRRAAKVLSDKTGELWTPAEIQETIWSWAKTLSEKAESGGKDVTSQKLLKAAGLTHEEIGNTPDFALLFADGMYRRILEEGGYGPRLETIARRRAGSRGTPSGSPLSAEGSGFAQPAFEQHLQRAAERLDTRAAQPSGKQ